MTRLTVLLLCLSLLGGVIGLPSASAQTQPAPPPAQTPPPSDQPAPSPPPAQEPELPFFGSDLLEQGVPTTAEALERAVSAKDYLLGPGDRLAINIWRSGKPSNQFDVAVPLEGRIFLPVVGEVLASGRTLERFKQELERQVTRRLPGFQVSILLTGLRGFRVLVMGEVGRPGYITANAVTRLSEVVAAARVNQIGSIRTIQVRKPGGVIHTADLYNFIARGSLADNPLVVDGQAIVVPRRYGLVEIRGAIGRPGRYEIMEGETIKDLLFFAGGPNADTYMQEFQLARFDEKSLQQPRVFLRLSLDRALRGDATQNIRLKDRDVIRVFSTLEFVKGNVVHVRGAVRGPGEFQHAAGMRVRDVLMLAGDPLPDAYMERAELSRIRPQGDGIEHREVILINLESVLKDPASPDNVLLRPGDVLTVYSLASFRGGTVRISGRVRQPGEYELVTGMRLRDLLFRSGGLLPDADLERVQLERIVNNEKAVLPLNLAKLLLEGDESQNVRLQFDDAVLIPSMLALARVVFVEGRVRNPGGYAWRENETVSTLLVRAGGPVLEEERPTSGNGVQAVQPLAPADLKAAYIERSTSGGTKTKLPVDLHRLIVDRDLSADVRLQPGDVLVVPGRIQQVFVQGFVELPGAFVFEPNRTVRHYIGLASPKPTADLQKVAVRRLDGSLGGGLDTLVQTGDTILVPEKRISALLQFLGLISPILQVILGR